MQDCESEKTQSSCKQVSYEEAGPRLCYWHRKLEQGLVERIEEYVFE